MKAEYTAQEIAALLGITRRAASDLAQRRGWLHREEPTAARGSDRKHYLVSSMEPAFVARLAAAEAHAAGVGGTTEVAQAAATSGRAPSGASATPPADFLPQYAEPVAAADAGADRIALARADLLRLYDEAVSAAPWGERKRVRAEFVSAFNAGGSHPLLYSLLGRVSEETLEAWRRKASQGQTESLRDRRGAWRRGRHGLTPEQEEIVIRCAVHPHAPRVSEAIRLAKAVMASRGIANGHSERTYRRFIDEWRRRNHHLWVMGREGEKAWNDRCAAYIERDYDAIAVGDVLVADGHILNFEVINPFTGKPCRMTLIVWLDMKSSYPAGWEIMPTENTAAIAAALRRAIIRLGKIPQVAYLDNGKAFASRFFGGRDLEQEGFAGLFARLGVRTIFAWPYHGQSKTVERFFGSFGELERLAPTYVGTSIADKPPRLKRGERMHRRLHEKATGGVCLTLEQAHRAVAAWFDMYAERPQRGHLAGRTPLEVFLAGRGPGVDRDRLAFLMMASAGRTIHRNGISFLGRNYYHPALYGRRHQATVRYDLQDPGALWVFDARDESFICVAEPVEKVHPAATALGSDADRERLAAAIRRYQDQRREAAASARAFLSEEVLPEYRRMVEGMAGPAHTAAAPAAERSPEPASRPLSEAERRRFEEELAELAAEQALMPPDPAGGDAAEDACPPPEAIDEAADALRLRLSRMGERERYEALLDLEAQGQLITREMRDFMVYFETTAAYARFRDDYENLKLALYSARR